MTSDLRYINTMTHDKPELYMSDNAFIVYPPSYKFVTTCNIIEMGNEYDYISVSKCEGSLCIKCVSN